MNVIYRLLPILMFACMCIMLWQFLSGAWAPLRAFLNAASGYLLALLFVMIGIMWAAWRHWRGDAPNWIYRLIPMDILDRLSNLDYIEKAAERLDKEAVLLDADKLSQDLQAKVVGQAQVCQDLAQQLRRRLAMTQRNLARSASSSSPVRPAPAKPSSPKCWQKPCSANCCTST